MNIKSFINIKKVVIALFVFIGLMNVNAQNNLKMLFYDDNTDTANPYGLDVTVLDAVFHNVYINGNTTPSTADLSMSTLKLSNIPTTLAGFGDAQVVLVRGATSVGTPTISLDQANTLIAYTKAGGILITNFRGVWVTGLSGTNRDSNKYIAEQLFSPTRT